MITTQNNPTSSSLNDDSNNAHMSNSSLNNNKNAKYRQTSQTFIDNENLNYNNDSNNIISQTLPKENLENFEKLFIHSLSQAKGSYVIIAKTNGDRYSGILFSANYTNGHFSIILKYAQLLLPDSDSVERNTNPWSEELIVNDNEFMHLQALNIPDEGQETHHSQNSQQRELKTWNFDSSAVDEIRDILDKPESNMIKNFDQFEANNIKSSYRDDLYTSSLDRDSEFYKKNYADAKKNARMIQSTETDNIHIVEDRDVEVEWNKVDDDVDEEDLYSRVLKQSSANMLSKNLRKPQKPPLKSFPPKKMNDIANDNDGMIPTQSMTQQTFPIRHEMETQTTLEGYVAEQNEFENENAPTNNQEKQQIEQEHKNYDTTGGHSLQQMTNEQNNSFNDNAQILQQQQQQQQQLRLELQARRNMLVENLQQLVTAYQQQSQPINPIVANNFQNAVQQLQANIQLVDFNLNRLLVQNDDNQNKMQQSIANKTDIQQQFQGQQFTNNVNNEPTNQPLQIQTDHPTENRAMMQNQPLSQSLLSPHSQQRSQLPQLPQSQPTNQQLNENVQQIVNYANELRSKNVFGSIANPLFNPYIQSQQIKEKLFAQEIVKLCTGLNVPNNVIEGYWNYVLQSQSEVPSNDNEINDNNNNDDDEKNKPSTFLNPEASEFVPDSSSYTNFNPSNNVNETNVNDMNNLYYTQSGQQPQYVPQYMAASYLPSQQFVASSQPIQQNVYGVNTMPFYQSMSGSSQQMPMDQSSFTFPSQSSFTSTNNGLNVNAPVFQMQSSEQPSQSLSMEPLSMQMSNPLISQLQPSNYF